ncbi:hypothetical protein Sjap_025524 [Stephania japonica]|uniref:F-box/LRR-repeat protein 15/At3g58940/PEG3-like LRR domain-containing protein n=1 Tax=Stephania japonica TaxID=461633 RepID=A0AAP0E510_9MAGN
MQNLKELHICFYYVCTSLELPYQIFTSSPITIFKLETNGSHDMKLPQAILSAPHLTTLELRDVQVPEPNLQGVVVFTCPLLESFVLERIFENSPLVLHITNEKLKIFSLDQCRSSMSVKLNSLNLSSLVYRVPFYPNCLTSRTPLSMIVDAQIYSKRESY